LHRIQHRMRDDGLHRSKTTVPCEGAPDYPMGGSSPVPFRERQEVGDPNVHVIGDPEDHSR
jgi:hypothetical protein